MYFPLNHTKRYILPGCLLLRLISWFRNCQLDLCIIKIPLLIIPWIHFSINILKVGLSIKKKDYSSIKTFSSLHDTVYTVRSSYFLVMSLYLWVFRIISWLPGILYRPPKVCLEALSIPFDYRIITSLVCSNPLVLDYFRFLSLITFLIWGHNKMV